MLTDFNYTMTEIMDVFNSRLSPALDIGAGCYLLFIAVLSIIGNLLVLVMAYKRRSKMKPTELLSVNLAVTDLGAAVTMYPLTVASAWSHHWLGGNATCIFYGLAGFFFGIASIMNLTILAVVRFVVALNLHTPSEKISWMKVKTLCLIAWLYALLWALFPILCWGRYGPEPFGLSCSLAWGEMKHSLSFVICIFILNLVAPSVIIFSCYFGMTIKLYFAYRKSSTANHRLPNIIRINRRMLVISVLISLGFLGCWGPYGLVSLWSIFHDSNRFLPEVSLLSCMFAKSSTVYNPLIYYFFSQSFQKEVKNLGWPCPFSRPCRVANSINDNAVHAVSPGMKPRMVPRLAFDVPETNALRVG